MDEMILYESKTMRNQYASKTEVLMVCGFDSEQEYTTIKATAAFYQVPEGTLKSVLSENRGEFEEDGLRVFTYAELKKDCGKLGIPTSEINHRGHVGLTMRCVLRAGMLLRDSARAKEIRTVLLNERERSLPMTEDELVSRALVVANRKLLQIESEKKQVEMERDAAFSRIGYLQCQKDLRATAVKIKEGPRRVCEHYGFTDYKEAERLIEDEWKKKTGRSLRARWAKERQRHPKLKRWEFLMQEKLADTYLSVIESLVANDSRGKQTWRKEKQDEWFL